ncbi:hypothetical protein [Faecalimonas umbilicata]
MDAAGRGCPDTPFAALYPSTRTVPHIPYTQTGEWVANAGGGRG